MNSKPIPSSQDIRKIVDTYCKENYNISNILDQSVKLNSLLNSAKKGIKLTDEKFYNKDNKIAHTALKDITNLRKSDSFITSNISMGNTPEKINVPNFPQIKDRIANREASGMKTPTTTL